MKMIAVTQLDQNQIYRYLGYQEQNHTRTPEIEALVQKCSQQILHIACPRAVFSSRLPLARGKELHAASLALEGSDISHHLEHCTEAVLLAVTLGAEVDTLIRRTETIDMAEAVVLDAAANVAVEQAAQEAEEDLRKILAQENLYLTGRYSPGYGDFPLLVQRDILRLADAGRKIGLSVTSSHIMTPKKSITAVLGIAKIPVKGYLAGCGHCVLRTTCLYRKRGETCAVSDQ